MKRKFLRLLFVLFFISMIVPITIFAPTASAQTYAGDISVTGNLTIDVPAGSADDYLDYYFDGATAGNNIVITVSGIDTPTESFEVDVYDSGFTDICVITDNDTCTLNNTPGGTFLVDVYELNSVAYGPFSIYLEEVAGSLPALTNGTVNSYNAVSPGTLKEYTIDVPAGKSDFQVATSVAAGSPDINLYVNEGSNVTADGVSDTCSSENAGPVENCTIATPANATYYVGLKEQTGTNGVVDVRAMYTEKTLTDGVDEANLSFTANEWKFYQIDVPANQATLDITTSGGTGDIDMYVSLGEYPLDDGTADASSESVGANESVSIPNPIAGTYYIGLLEVNASTASSIILNADYSPPTNILNGEIISNASATTGDYDYYKITIPSGASNLYISTSGGTGTSADLYHKYNSIPTTSNADNSSATAGTNSESILITSPTAGDHYIGVYANGGDFSGVQLTAEFVNGTLSKGVDQSITDLDQNEWEYYEITLPSAATDLTVSTTGGSGDVSVYAKYNDFPQVSSNDGSSETAGSNEESFVITNPSSGNWRVGVKGESIAVSSTTLNVDYTSASATTMTNGQTLTNLSGSLGEWNYYKVTLPANALNLQVKSSGGTGNADLYLRYSDFPNASTYDCLSSEVDNNEQCVVSTTSSGDYYFGLYGAAAYSGVNLTVIWDETGTVTGTSDWEYGAQILDPDTEGKNSGWGYDVDVYRGATADYMIVSSDNHIGVGSGAAWIYKRNGSNWDLQEGNANCASFTNPVNDCLLPTNPILNTKVAIDDINAMVGENDTDGVYAFRLDTVNGDWEMQTGSIKSSDFDATDDFGFDIDIDGGYAVFGAPLEDENGSDAGAAYIFNWNGSNWVQQAKLIRDNCSVGGSGIQDCSGDQFGYSVAISGDYVIIGAPFHKYDEAGTLLGGGGATYIYKRTGTSWALEDKMLSLNHGTNDHFGYSAAIDGTTAVVGAIYGDHPDDTDVGAAYVFEQNGTSWDQQDQLEQIGFAPTPSRDLFGNSVGVYGDYALIGAPDHNNQSNGKLYLFENSAGTWSQISTYVGDFNLGFSVALDGNDFYGVGGSPQGGGPIVLQNLGGSSGGAAVPEFSDYVYIVGLLIAIFLMFKIIPKIVTQKKRI